MHDPGNFRNALVVVDQVLPDLDPDVRESDFLGVVIDREILRRLARIRFVVADAVAAGAQADRGKSCGSYRPCPTAHPFAIRTRFSVEDRRETVDGYQHRRRPGLGQAFDLVRDRNVIRPVDRARPQVLVGLVQVSVAGYEDAVAVLEERTRVHELPVAVDHESRVGLDDTP